MRTFCAASALVRLLAAAIAFLAIAPELYAQQFTVLHVFKGPQDGSFPYGGLVLDRTGNIYGAASRGGLRECLSDSDVDLGCGTVFQIDPSGNLRTLHRFNSQSGGNFPHAALVLVGGSLYGVTVGGGNLDCSRPHGCGTVFKLDRPYAFSTVYNFAGEPDASRPTYPLTGDPGGNLYGASTEGGRSTCGGLSCGTVFKIDASGTETILHLFDGSDGSDGYSPGGPLVRDRAGNFYGTATYGGGITPACRVGCGLIYKIDWTGNFSVFYHFMGAVNGHAPSGTLALDSVGNLYGTTLLGGSCGRGDGCGVVYRLDAKGLLTVLYAFHGGTDGHAANGVLRDADGNLYGTTYWGGENNAGTVFKIDSNGTERVLHSFGGLSAPDGAYPAAGVVRDSAGNLYGTTLSGGSCYNLAGCGVVYKITP